MAKFNRLISQSIPLFAASIFWLSAVSAETPTVKVSAFEGGVRSEAVWKDPGFFDLVNQCRQANTCSSDASASENQQCLAATNTCITNKMRAKGASAQAVAFTQFNAPVPAAIDQFKKYGKVAVVHARMQLADASEGFFFINDKGLIIPVESPSIEKSAVYQKFLKQYPKAFMAGGAGQLDWPKVTSIANDSQQFVFAFPLVDGCKACARVGAAQVAFTFDRAGNYLGNRLLKIDPVAKSAASNNN